MYRPPIDPGQYEMTQKTRTSCPSCGAAITPEQDAQIIEQDRQRQESLIEKIQRQQGQRQPEQPIQPGQQPGQKRYYYKPGDNVRVWDRETGEHITAEQAANIPDFWSQVDRFDEPSQQPGQPGKQKPFPVDGLWDRKLEDNTTGEYLGYVDGKLQTFPNEQAANDAGASGVQPNYKRHRPVQPGQPGQSGKQKPFPVDDLWKRKRDEETGERNQWGDPIGTKYPAVEGPGNPAWEARQKKKYPQPEVGDTGEYKPLPVDNLSQRKQQETGFYQGPSAAERRKGAVWGASGKPTVGQGQQLPNFGATGNEGTALTRDRRKSTQGVMGKMY